MGTGTKDFGETPKIGEMGVVAGGLYVVATPIGNLADTSFRARAVLSQVDAILCEDTRVTGLYCQALGIDRPKESFHQHNAMKRVEAIINRLKAGQTLALVSDRGLPTVSDPGRELVQACRDAGIWVSVVPGPSAVTTAFAGSGYSHPFVFWGFLPAVGQKRRQALEDVAESLYTQIFYEAPHRLQSTLADFERVLGSERELTVARELTKPYEEFWSGTVQSALVASEQGRFRGEMVLVLAPVGPRHPARLSPASDAFWAALVALVSEYVDQGLSDAEAIRRVAAQFRVPRRTVYKKVHG